ASGWNPDSGTPNSPGQLTAIDRAQVAARPFSGRSFAVRIAPGLLGESVGPRTLAETLANSSSYKWRALRDILLGLALPDELREALNALDNVRRPNTVKVYDDLYGYDAQGRPRGIVFFAPFGMKNGSMREYDQRATTEDDVSGSLPGFSLALSTHST